MKPRLLLTMLSLGACATHQTGSLIGCDLDDVRSRYGPPVTCTAGGGAWTLSYRDASGALVEGAVAVVDDVVVAAASGLQRNAVTDENRWTGARIEEVVAALGPGSIESVGSGVTTLRFGEWRFCMVDGRVVGMTLAGE